MGIKTLRPCDCKDRITSDKLHKQGISINDTSLCVKPAYVELIHGHTTIKINMVMFKKLAEWYLEEQLIE